MSAWIYGTGTWRVNLGSPCNIQPVHWCYDYLRWITRSFTFSQHFLHHVENILTQYVTLFYTLVCGECFSVHSPSENRELSWCQLCQQWRQSWCHDNSQFQYYNVNSLDHYGTGKCHYMTDMCEYYHRMTHILHRINICEYIIAMYNCHESFGIWMSSFTINNNVYRA